MAAEKRKDAGKPDFVNVENMVIGLLIIVIFIASYYFFSNQLRERQVNELKVFSKGDPYAEMKAILADKKIIIKQMLFPGEDDRNSYVGVVSAEIAGALSYFNKSVGVYGFVPEEANESERLLFCTKDTDFCKNEKIVVQLNDCNCVRIQDNIIYVLYGQERLKDQRLRLQLRGTLGGVLRG